MFRYCPVPKRRLEVGSRREPSPRATIITGPVILPDGGIVPAKPTVDVGVVTWNSAELTATALRRLLDTDQGCDLRLLVRDNASSDGTAEILAERVPEAEIEAGRENLGFARGMNRLLSRAEAPWFFVLNPDAWPDAGAIATLVATALARPRAAAVVPRIENPDGSLQHSTYPFPSLRVAASTLVGAHRIGPARADRMQLEGSWMHDRARLVDWAIGAAMLLRREALDDVGSFDETYFMYVEDLEWCWRARRLGWEVFFEPAAVVKHVGNASGAMGYGDRRTAAYMRNTYRFYRREHGGIATAAYRALNLAGAGTRYAAARISHDASTARYWRLQLKANLESARSDDIRPVSPE